MCCRCCRSVRSTNYRTKQAGFRLEAQNYKTNPYKLIIGSIMFCRNIYFRTRDSREWVSILACWGVACRWTMGLQPVARGNSWRDRRDPIPLHKIHHFGIQHFFIFKKLTSQNKKLHLQGGSEGSHSREGSTDTPLWDPAILSSTILLHKSVSFDVLDLNLNIV